ncbi:BamA/TamA family outer membrane protein [Ramlibacter sp. G-1-2-2]|uniref:BamA/TamA family outer membrane protein n=1 Tax=Ramlibacter agri TaxID=2728837 RepID=A0A848H362_9BURK|nr:BamA/TamA family outer membrane protein [Ramlibacter agri]NML42228.1 BamA/TamA family outer membrane protein [Ramlibacter agri]
MQFSVRLALCTLLLVLPWGARADFLEGFRDKEDGRIDLSDWLLDRKGVLPVPIFITEPAVGYGGGLVALFFRQSMAEKAQQAKESGKMTPPDIYAIGGAATENGTKAAFAGGMVTSDDGRWRWRGGIAKIDANLDFYGIGGNRGPLRYNLQGIASVQHGMMRIGQSDTWFVARWNYLDLDNRFGSEQSTAIFGPIVRSNTASGLGVSIETDTRDTIFTPSRGWTGSLDLTFYNPSWGSDTTFQSYRAHVFAYWPVAKSLVLAGRADARAANGSVPFFMLPYIDLRGVPLGRLQDERTGVLETELRWNLDARWALIGFLGAGRAWGTNTSFSEGAGTVSKGVGFRYMLARRMGLYAGVDWAWSTQDHAWYLTVGSAWR